MKNFIEELYYGNIDPQNSGFEDNAGVQRELRTISENEDWLTEHLTGEEKKRFLDFADAWSAYNGDATLDGFITGFRLGANSFLVIRRPADKAAVFRHYKHTVSVTALLHQDAAPHLALRAKRGVILNELPIRNHVRDEILIVDLRQLHDFYNLKRALLFHQMKHRQVFYPTRIADEISLPRHLHILTSLNVAYLK